jgi:hypothetical protein
MNDFILAASFLKESEKNAIIHQLEQQGINYLINKHGAASRTRSYYFEIKVDPIDSEKAAKIINDYKINLLAQKNNCPYCKSSFYEPIKLSFFKRLLFIGTTPVKCKNCKKTYGI